MEATSAGPGGYEFSQAENAVIARTARWTRVWGWLWLFCGALLAIIGALNLPGGVVTIIFGAVYLLIGWLFKGAGDSLRAVVDTTGSDIRHLMTALQKLGSVFKTTMILTLVGLGLAILASVAAYMLQDVI
jgi:hypothetical protein